MQVSDLGFEVAFEAESLDSGSLLGESVLSFARPTCGAEGLELKTGVPATLVRIAPVAAAAWVGEFEAGPGGITGVFVNRPRFSGGSNSRED